MIEPRPGNSNAGLPPSAAFGRQNRRDRRPAVPPDRPPWAPASPASAPTSVLKTFLTVYSVTTQTVGWPRTRIQVPARLVAGRRTVGAELEHDRRPSASTSVASRAGASSPYVAAGARRVVQVGGADVDQAVQHGVDLGLGQGRPARAAAAVFHSQVARGRRRRPPSRRSPPRGRVNTLTSSRVPPRHRAGGSRRPPADPPGPPAGPGSSGRRASAARRRCRAAPARRPASGTRRRLSGSFTKLPCAALRDGCPRRARTPAGRPCRTRGSSRRRRRPGRSPAGHRACPSGIRPRGCSASTAGRRSARGWRGRPRRVSTTQPSGPVRQHHQVAAAPPRPSSRRPIPSAWSSPLQEHGGRRARGRAPVADLLRDADADQHDEHGRQDRQIAL